MVTGHVITIRTTPQSLTYDYMEVPTLGSIILYI